MNYNSIFYSGQKEGSLRSARTVVPLLFDIIPSPKSVVDIGCGLGTWLFVIKEQGIENILGIDGDWIDRDQLLIPNERFRSIDLTKPFELIEKFDLAISLEVAEHLPSYCADFFVASLCKLAPIVLFSSALPCQGGANHLNEQWPDYWQELFSKQNFIAFDPLRRLIWYDESVEWWYQQNMFLFVRKDHVDSNPVFHNLPKVTGKDGNCLTLVHYKILEGNPTSLKLNLRRLPRLLIIAFKKRIGRVFFKIIRMVKI